MVLVGRRPATAWLLASVGVLIATSSPATAPTDEQIQKMRVRELRQFLADRDVSCSGPALASKPSLFRRPRPRASSCCCVHVRRFSPADQHSFACPQAASRSATWSTESSVSPVRTPKNKSPPASPQPRCRTKVVPVAVVLPQPLTERCGRCH